jgi:hypothetical protein
MVTANRGWFVKCEASCFPSSIKKAVRLETIRLSVDARARAHTHTHSVTAETEIRVMWRLSAYSGHYPGDAVGVRAADCILHPVHTHTHCRQLWPTGHCSACTVCFRQNQLIFASRLISVCVNIYTHIHTQKSKKIPKF